MTLDSKARDRQMLAGKRFLVVGDHPYMIDVIVEILRHYGAVDVERADGVPTALAHCNPKDPFDCIICDFNMKPINGVQPLQAARAGKRPELKREQAFILLTGHGDMGVVKAAKALDVSAYVVKPVAADTFVKAVTRALEARPALKLPADYERVPTGDLKRFQ